MRSIAALALILCSAVAVVARAGEEKEKPEPPYHQFPDLPEVLFYDGFEQTNSASKGSPSEEQANPPGRKSLKFATQAKNVVQAIGTFGRSKFPDGNNPSNVFMAFSIFASDVGKITFKVTTGKAGEYTETLLYTKASVWQQFSIKLADFRNANKPMVPDNTVSKFEITFTPKGADAPSVYMDEFCITANVKPEAVMGRIASMEGKVADVTRSNTKDGFTYTAAGNDALKAALKAAGKRHKSKTVLIMGAKPGDAPDILKALTAASSKTKIGGYSYVASTSPDSSAVGGLEDVRTLLPYNLQKSDAEFALLVFSNADGGAIGRNYDAVKAAIDRALDSGVIPIVILPPPGGKADGFIGGAMRFCTEAGVPYVDTASVIKPLKDALDGAELSASGLEAVCGTALAAMKHTETNIRK